MRFALALFLLLSLCSTPIFAADDDTSSPSTSALQSTLHALKTGARATGDFAKDTSLLAPDSPYLYKSLSASYLALSVLDWRTTTMALRDGCEEKNVLMTGIASSPAAFLLTKVAAGSATLYLTERLRTRKPIVALAVLVAANGAMTAVVAHNAALVRGGAR